MTRRDDSLGLRELPCVLCGELLDPASPGTWYRIQGFERPRRQGGANQIVLREVIPGLMAHDACVALARAKAHPGQGTLL
jgi:hypothetical protein